MLRSWSKHLRQVRPGFRRAADFDVSVLLQSHCPASRLSKSVRHDIAPLDFLQSLKASAKQREHAEPMGSRLTPPVFLVPGWVDLKRDHQLLLSDLVDLQIEVTPSNRIGRAT
jgi:hypothetical protein